MSFKLGIQRTCYPPIEDVVQPCISMHNPPDNISFSAINKEINEIYGRYEKGSMTDVDNHRLYRLIQSISSIMRERCSQKDLDLITRMCAKISIMQGK